MLDPTGWESWAISIFLAILLICVKGHPRWFRMIFLFIPLSAISIWGLGNFIALFLFIILTHSAGPSPIVGLVDIITMIFCIWIIYITTRELTSLIKKN